MECPKCKAQNPDDAVCCSLCYEQFKAKPKPAPSKSRKIAFGDADMTFDDWFIEGPLVIGENGLYFFVESCTSVKESTGDKVGGQVGGIAGVLVGMAVDHAMGSEEPTRPEKLEFRPSAELMNQCADVMADAPNIAGCSEYFRIEKRDILKVEFTILSGLCVTTALLGEVSIGGVSPPEKASAFFKTQGYPYQE